ncbi:hypothetical protein FOL47_010650 [Perkinsus chesapeaki]|uniref:Radial spoke head protein 3 n=1 Tax=Perkinsus chesapeaki TaxID=330153 RepID=A0A7J6L193_PERCH|nr:hypothetical protein FOL47_010650 [Perkinsus chesapeaki]
MTIEHRHSGGGVHVDPRVVRGSTTGYFTRARIDGKRMREMNNNTTTNSSIGVGKRLPPIQSTKSLRRRLREVFEKVSSWGQSGEIADSSDNSTVGFEDNLIEKMTAAKPKLTSVGTEIDEFHHFVSPYKRDPTLPPLRIGRDSHTQIEEKYIFDHLDGEEVRREVIDVIVDKTIQQSLEEVREEEEEKAITEFQRQWHERQKAENRKYEEMEEMERDRHNRTQKMIEEAERRTRARQQIEGKLEALKHAKMISDRILKEMMSKLNRTGRFADPLLYEAEQLLSHQLMSTVLDEEDELHKSAGEVTAALIHQAAIERAQKLKESRSASKAETALLRVFMMDPSDAARKIPIGPISVESSTPLADILYRIQRWIAINEPDVLKEAAGSAFASTLQLSTTPLLELCVPATGELLHSTEELFNETLTGKIAVRKKMSRRGSRIVEVEVE